MDTVQEIVAVLQNRLVDLVAELTVRLELARLGLQRFDLF